MRNLSVIKGLYQGNGVTRRWAIPFEYNDKSQIFVTITTFDEGDYTYRVLDRTEYTIDEDSVEIVYPKTDDDAPIPSTQYLTVWRDTDLLQLMDLTNQGAAWPDSIEASLDKLHQIVQELAEGLSRSLKVDIGDPQTPDEKLVAIQDYVLAAAESSRSASSSAVSANQAAESAATSAANAAESERLASGYADTATAAAGRAEDSAISARAYNAPDYDNETTYQAGEVVTYTDGNSYRALQETTGNEPPNIIYWQKVTDYVGDDFFEVDEYGYIVPMDSPSHSRYWRVDQNGYIVPIEGGDGGYRPDTRSLSSEYLNVTNEGYIKHLRADDIAAQEVDADEVTAEVAAFNTLTANAVNAGTVTANDIIAKGPIVDVRAFGAVGDGVHDDTVAIQSALNIGNKVYFPKGRYRITESISANKSLYLVSDDAKIVISNTTNFTSISTMGGATAYKVFDITGTSSDIVIVSGITIINTSNNALVGFCMKSQFSYVEFSQCKGYNLKNSLVYCGVVTYETIGTNTEATALATVGGFVAHDCYAEYGGEGQNPALFHVFCPAAVNIYDNQVYKSYGYGIRVHGGSYNTIPNAVKGSRNINIHNNNINGWGTSLIAIQVTKSVNVNVTDNLFLGIDDDGFESSDNAVDIFNCHNVKIDGNVVNNCGGLFAGHGDLNYGTMDGIVGTRDVTIANNQIRNTKNNAIFIGGDGTVDGARAGHRFAIHGNNIYFDNDHKTGLAAIYSFLCNNIDFSNNTINNAGYVIKTYFDKGYYVHDNVVMNVAQVVNITGSDASTKITHVCKNNICIDSGDFSALGVVALGSNSTSVVLDKTSDHIEFSLANGVISNGFTLALTKTKRGVVSVRMRIITSSGVSAIIQSAAYIDTRVLCQFGTNASAVETNTVKSNVVDSGYTYAFGTVSITVSDNNITVSVPYTAGGTIDYTMARVIIDYEAVTRG